MLGAGIGAVLAAVEYLLGPGEWCGRRMFIGIVTTSLTQVGIAVLLIKRMKELKEESLRRDSP